MPKMTAIRLACVFAPLAALATPAHAVRGDAAALAAAEKLLEQVGGRETWSQRTLTVRETGYLRSGEVADIRIWRDFETGSLRLERTTPTQRYSEWSGERSAWTARNGVLQILTPAEHAVERQGFRQEPYAVYHRLARRDPGLRVQLRDDGRTLTIYDRDERVLCWFNLDAQGKLLGWGNHYDGNLNQHYYGPLIDLGNVNLPKFGAASTGVFRFEYIAGNLSNDPVAEPPKPAP